MFIFHPVYVILCKLTLRLLLDKLSETFYNDMFFVELLILFCFPLVLACSASYLTWNALSRPALFLIVATVALYLVYASSMWLLAPGPVGYTWLYGSQARLIHQNHGSQCYRHTRFPFSFSHLQQFPCWRSYCEHSRGHALMRSNWLVNRSANGGPPNPSRRYAVHFHRPWLGVSPSSPGYIKHYKS